MADAQQENGAVRARFNEQDNGKVVVNFDGVGSPFSITLTNMNWGLFEDLDKIESLRSEGANDDPREMLHELLGFWHKYVEGGPKAVPFKHTFTVFNAISGYLQESFAGASEKN